MSISQFGRGKEQTSSASAQIWEDKPVAITAARNELLEVSGGWERILVVDDDRVARTTALRLLKQLGYTVETCANGSEALARLIGSIQSFDLLFTDYDMPGLSGYELACRAQERHSDLRVVLTSGWPEEFLRYNAVWSTWPVFLSKPYTQRSLARKVREALAMPAPSRLVAIWCDNVPALDDHSSTEDK